MAERRDGEGGGRKPPGAAGRNRNAYCSFCRRSHRDVGPLVEGPSDVYICGECIDLCQSIIEQERKRRGSDKADKSAGNIPSPRSIKEQLDQYVIGQPRAIVPRSTFSAKLIFRACTRRICSRPTKSGRST